MKLLTCPINGPRPLQEFAYGGVVREMPDAAASSDAEWADYVFNRTGEPGTHREWWYHLPSGTWFIAERDNVKDIIVRTYLYSPRGATPDAAAAPTANAVEAEAVAASTPSEQV